MQLNAKLLEPLLPLYRETSEHLSVDREVENSAAISMIKDVTNDCLREAALFCVIVSVTLYGR